MPEPVVRSGEFVLRQLSDRDDLTGFSCGRRPGAAEIDSYLQSQARTEHAAKLCVVWLALDESALRPHDRLLGFFTLSPLSIPISSSLITLINLSTSPYPAVGGYLLGRLGVAAHRQGQNFGDVLVFSAIKIARIAVASTAGSFLAVDPKNDGLVAWYERLGFHRLDAQSKKRRMVFRL